MIRRTRLLERLSEPGDAESPGRNREQPPRNTVRQEPRCATRREATGVRFGHLIHPSEIRLLLAASPITMVGVRPVPGEQAH
ncbi:hypothetical protein GCM10009613_39060 [Pseudonocardia kongjuensis]|uniref:Uncharacterized protein n=1 Tax=Pseudonocardia kongjuensis TaxID=102227 RepID=A0ABN1Y3A8_9PSEU